MLVYERLRMLQEKLRAGEDVRKILDSLIRFLMEKELHG